MARARNIKPGFFKNELLAQCEHGARILFTGLWCLADREGRLEDRPMRIKAEIFPYESVDVDAYLRQLQSRGFIVRYVVDGCNFIQVNNFCKHQNPHCKESASTIQAPCAHQSSLADSPILIPDSLSPPIPAVVAVATDGAILGIQPKEEKPKRNRRTYGEDFQKWYSIYPFKAGKIEAEKAFNSAVNRIASERAISPQEAIAELRKATTEYARSPKGQSGNYAGHPATWLNAGHYDDDRAAWNQPRSTNGQHKPAEKPRKYL